MLRHLKLKVEIKIKTIKWCLSDKELLEKYKTIWIKIEGMKNIELNALPIYDDTYTKVEIRT